MFQIFVYLVTLQALAKLLDCYNRKVSDLVIIIKNSTLLQALT